MSDIFEILKLFSVCLLLTSIFSVSNRAEVWRVRCLLWWLMKFVFRIWLLSEWVDSNERLNVDILSQHATLERVCKHLVDIVSRMTRFHWRVRLFKFGTLHPLNNKGNHQMKWNPFWPRKQNLNSAQIRGETIYNKVRNAKAPVFV